MRKLVLLLTLVVACSSSPEEEGSGTDPRVSDTGGRGGVDRGADSGGRGGRTDTGSTGSDAGGGDALDDVAQPEDASDTTPSDALLDAEPPSDASTDVPPPQDTTPPRDTRDVPRGTECAQVSAVGDPVYAPIDIIWAIDTSGSMNEEAALIESELNEFVSFITASGLEDVRVIMVAADSVCVPAPLSGGGCPDSDSETYLHVRQTVGSYDAFEVLVNAYPRYSGFLRREAIKHIVVVSDDESAREPNWFRDNMRAAGLNFFVFHAIVSLTGTTGIFTEGCSGPYGDAEAKGDKYMLLSEMTGGTASSICEPDWTDTFVGIGTNALAGATLPCEYGIPDIGTGREIVYEEVDVRLNGGRPITRHMDASGCMDRPGWYYDNNSAPTKIHMCPDLCGSGFSDVRVDIEFGCVKG